ncbi:MerR family transcriptional regulator [Puia sp.]|jgi:DNA-binding transcriptional MerR regulator|uniref:MerR family transcriptional regulator n=1 Tax=Puia sp. TaxID=2045100 RepID=UPI002F400151
MSSNLTQIALDFGPEPQSQPVPPATGNGTGDEAARPYLAAGGVGVRVKSFKQPSPPAPPVSPPPEASSGIATRPTVKVTNGNLFGSPAPIEESEMLAEEPQAATPAATVHAVPPIHTVDTIPTVHAAQPEPTARPEAAAQPAQPAQPVPAVQPEPTVRPVHVIQPEPAVQPEPIAAAPTPEPEIAASAEPAQSAEDPIFVAPTTRRRTPPGRSAAAKHGPSKRGRKSLKEVSAEAQLIEIPTDEVLFSKQYYTMGEVSEMFRVNQSLLRFWETEFDILQPKKNKKGDRYFRPVDIKNLHLIYHLLRQKKYTIEGAKDFLKKNKKAEDRFEVIQRLQQIKAFLVEWKAQL